MAGFGAGAVLMLLVAGCALVLVDSVGGVGFGDRGSAPAPGLSSAESEPTASADDLPARASTTTPVPSTSAPTIQSADGDCFRLVLRDDFGGTTLGPEWSVYDSPGAHSRYSIRRPEAVTVGGGRLVLTAAEDDDGVLVSGGLRHRHAQRYGYYAVRVRTDADLAEATSGVVLTWPTSNDQPRDGENNLYETGTDPGDRAQFYSFIHAPFDDQEDGVTQERFVHDADATAWQTMTMAWTPERIVVTRTGPDGVTETQVLAEDASDRITDAEHFLAIQLDQFEPSLGSGEDVRMEVDWVEIYEPCDDLGTG